MVSKVTELETLGFFCKYCDKKYNTKSGMYRHIKKCKLKDMVSSKSDLKGLEAVKELNEDKIEKLDNQSAELKNDIIGLPDEVINNYFNYFNNF